MESATKNKQTNEDIIKMVQKAFGEDLNLQDIMILELTEGFFNVAYEIKLPDQEVILKIAPETDANIMSYEKNIMQAEVEGLRLVKEKTVVPVPEVYFYDDSRSICNASYFFMEKIEGESLSQLGNKGMQDEEWEKIKFDTGRYNREINSIIGKQFGYLGQPEKQGNSWRETFLSMISDVLTDGEKIGIDIGVNYNDIRNLIHNVDYVLDEVKLPVFVHWDLWEGNIFVKDGKITGIIDFERCLWGDPLIEHGFCRDSYKKEFVKGYGTDLRSIAPVRALLYDIYLYLIMTVETNYRNYPDDWQYNFASGELKASLEELRSLTTEGIK